MQLIAAEIVSSGVEAVFAEADETAKKGPGEKLFVTYEIARQFPGYSEKDGVTSSDFADRIIQKMRSV
jgi:isocitrate dehydrogenase